MKKTIQIPKTVEDALKPKEWIKFIVENRIKDSENGLTTLIIDFSLTEYVYTLQLVSLACLIEEYYQKKVKIEFIECLNSKSYCSYLNDIKFFKYWEDDFDRSIHTTVNNDNTLCLWHINQAMINSYLNKAIEFAERLWIEGKDFSPLHQSIAEIFNNINDHSDSKISGYIITQHHPTHKELRISVCDFGIGIVNSVNRYFKKKDNAMVDYAEAIKKAFELKFTVGSRTHNMGMGLSNIRENVCMSGDLNIYTNKVHLDVKPKKLNTFILSQHLEGTIIDIVIYTDKLSKVEDDNFDVNLS